MPKAGFLKLCNYCKNHTKPEDPPVLEKHHRPCEKYNNKEHFKDCKPCERNHRKTENVRIWRANKANKKPSDILIKNIVAELMKGNIFKNLDALKINLIYFLDEEIYEIVNSQKVDQISSDVIIEMTSDDFIMVEESGKN